MMMSEEEIREIWKKKKERLDGDISDLSKDEVMCLIDEIWLLEDVLEEGSDER